MIMEQNWEELLKSLPSWIYFVTGAMIGSFLNVCIYRLPQGQSIVKPRSRCYHCQKLIPWYYNIPVFAWFFLRGRTACCHQALPFRYPLVEMLTGALAALIKIYISTAPLAIFVFSCLLIVSFFTDIDTLLIPDEITLGGIVAACLFCYFYPELQGERNAFLGMVTSAKNACLSMGALFLFISLVEFFLKREAMGLGDVKLIGCIGAFCGWPTCCLSIFGGALLGTVYIALWAIFLKLRKKPIHSLIGQVIPFGPFMVIATFYAIFLHPTFLEQCRSFLDFKNMPCF